MIDTQNMPRRFFSYRSIVLGLLFSVTAINYLDRQTLSIVAPLLREHLSLSTTAYSRVVFLFLLGYTIGQSLDGRIIDRIGARIGILSCVALWCVISVLHSLVMGAASLGVLRFLLGVAEAGNWPGGVKAVAENFASEQRAFGIGVFNSGSSIGAIIAPPLVAVIVSIWGWRPMFVAVGGVGLVWVLLWSRFYRKEPPARSIIISATEPYFGKSTVLHDRAVWALMFARFLADPVWWFYAFWLPEYLAQSRGFSLVSIGRTAWIPFAFAGVGGWVGGLASDGLVRRHLAPVTARKIVMVAGAFLMLGGIPAAQVRSDAVALALISVVLFGYTGWATNILGLVTDLFSVHHVAQVTGFNGTSGAIGGMLFTLGTGWLVQNVSYRSVFIVSSGMILCALIVTIGLVPRNRPLVG